MNSNRLIASDPLYSAWVAASAGTGKTKLLTDRVLRLLLQGTPPEKILCLTFTKSAAAEMSNRIAMTLGNWFCKEEEELRQDLLNLTGQHPEPNMLIYAQNLFLQNLDSINDLKIQTIHSFCQSMLQKFPLEAGLPPNFVVIDEFLANDLLSLAKHNLLQKLDRAEFSQAATAMTGIASILYESSINQLLTEAIANSDKILDLIAYHHNLDNLIQYVYEQLGCVIGDTPEIILARFMDDPTCEKEELKNISYLLQMGSVTDISRGNVILNWHNSPHPNLLTDYIGCFLTLEDCPKKALATKPVVKLNPEVLTILSKEQKRVYKFRQLQKSCKIATLTTHLLHLHMELIKEYTQLKKSSSYLDYSDLIITALNLLTNKEVSEWIKYKLDLSIDHILVDEAQDISKEQWSIIHSLAVEFFASQDARTLFVVGDEKQSIFSFQGANPHIFMQMKNYFSAYCASQENPLHLLTLETSYRSVPAVLQMVDIIFTDHNLKSAITTSELKIKHKAHRNLAKGYVEIWPLIQTKNEEKDDHIWPIPNQMIIQNHAYVILADLIVAKIEEWLLNKRILLSKNRPVKAGDIMILVRRRNNFTEYLVKALKRKAIPTAGLDKITLTESIAILDLIAAANFVLLPSDDLNLACLLKSPLLNLNEDELSELAAGREDTSLWQSLQNKQHDQPSFQQAYHYLIQLLEIKDQPAFAFYSYLLDRLGARRALCSSLTKEVNDQLDELLNLALKHQAAHPASLQGFVHYFQSSNIVIKRDLETHNAQVKIMTVHSAKGLQAPIVILPDTTAIALGTQKLLWSDDNLLLWPGSTNNENFLCQQLKAARAKDEKDEYIRLLYVALTRAEDETIICGWQNKLKPSDDCWYNIVAREMIKHSQKMPFILPNNFKHDLSCFGQNEICSYRYINNNLE